MGLPWATRAHARSCSAQKCSSAAVAPINNWRRARPVRVACQARGSTSRMSIRPSMDPEEMSWPGNRAPLDGRWGELRKGISFKYALYAGTPNVCVRRFPPSAEHSSHDGTYRQGGRPVSDITLSVSFPSTFLFPIKVHRDPASGLFQPCLPFFGCLFVFSPSLLCAFP